MAVLYFKNPADGQWYPIIGSDVSGKADKTYVDNELDKKLDKTGGVLTGNVDLNNVLAGAVWNGLYRGIQQDDSVSNDSAALLLGNSEKAGITYLIGNKAAGGGKIVLRPQADGGGTYDFTIDTGGLSIPQTPTAAAHAVRRDYADGQALSANSGSISTSVSTSYVPINFDGANTGTEANGALWSSNYVFRLTKKGVYLVVLRLTIAPHATTAGSSLAIGTNAFAVQMEFSDVYIPSNWTWRQNASVLITKTTDTNEEYSILAKNSAGARNYNYNQIWVQRLSGDVPV